LDPSSKSRWLEQRGQRLSSSEIARGQKALGEGMSPSTVSRHLRGEYGYEGDLADAALQAFRPGVLTPDQRTVRVKLWVVAEAEPFVPLRVSL
jgi:hypothetical protein